MTNSNIIKCQLRCKILSKIFLKKVKKLNEVVCDVGSWEHVESCITHIYKLTRTQISSVLGLEFGILSSEFGVRSLELLDES